MSGTVYLVGAGPGDPGLITVRGRELLARADVVVYDRLVGSELLELCRIDAQRVFVGKQAGRHSLGQDEINALLVSHAKAGASVCRLKGGDPYVFGRGGEEALYCREHGVRFEEVPGVTSSIAGPAYAGIPVTHREVATSFAVVTGHTATDDAPPETLPVADTLIFLMGVRALTTIVAKLLARGDSPELPVALVRWGTTLDQQVVTGTLATIEREVELAGLTSPALIVVGEVVRLRERLRWFDDVAQRPLWGQTIIVTRARAQASELVEGLGQLGARVVQCPAIRVTELDCYDELNSAIGQLGAFDWVVFTSVNGVEAFWKRLRRHGGDARLLAGARLCAIGPATAAALESRGLHADFVPESSISEAVADGLIGLGAGGAKILVARAREGREVLGERLQKAGAQVTVAPCYATVSDRSTAEIARELLEAGTVNWVTFTSSSTVSNFVDAIGADVVKRARASFRVACIGPVTASTARDCGLTSDVVAADASTGALVEAMIG